MKQSGLTGIPTPLDSEKDHAANVDYVQRKKRSLEVVVGEEEDNNGGGTGEEKYEDKEDGTRIFTMIKKNIPIEAEANGRIPWGEAGYQPTIGDINKIFQLEQKPNGERPDGVKILVPGTLSFLLKFRGERGQGKFKIYESDSHQLEEEIDFPRNSIVTGTFTFRTVSKTNPAQIYIINTTPDTGFKLKGDWDWEITYIVKISDIPSD